MKKYLIITAVLALTLGGCTETQLPSETKPDTPVSNTVSTEKAVTPTEKPADNVPTEYKSALKSAEVYSDMMHMSKQGIYDQLTSEYGDKFTAEAAQYAIDNLKADYKLNALKSAESYQETMYMSPAAIHDQLTSEYGEKFTQEEADYAIANLK